MAEFDEKNQTQPNDPNNGGKKGGIFDMPDHTNEFEKEDIEKNKVLSLFSYIGILFLIPLFAAKDSKFARFHINQGIVLAIIEIIVSIICSILGMIPYVGWIFSILGGLVGVCALVLAILGIINAVNGQAKELPIIGKIKILK